jgi:hypothetical protein
MAAMTVNNFLKLINYKPVWISKPSKIDSGIQNIEFRRINNHTASIEFGREFREDKNGYYFYFEIIDWNNYVDGDVISLNSSRRKNVIFKWLKSDEEYREVAKQVNKYLKTHYKRK